MQDKYDGEKMQSRQKKFEGKKRKKKREREKKTKKKITKKAERKILVIIDISYISI